MAEILLLPEQQFTSVYVEGTGWCWDIPATFDLVPGQSYRIVFDGAEWPCIAVDISAMIPNTVAIGNGAAFGLPGNGEPFVVMDYIGGDEISILCLTDSANQNTHTISIYGEESGEPEEPEQPEQPEEPESPKVSNDAVLLSYSQNPVVYNNIPKVWLTHPDSTEENPILVPFTYGESVSKEVAPDFSGGDMAVEIPDGELVTGLTVKKPEELVPENIPEGQYIAGVGPGTFKGGSEGVEKTVELDFSDGDMTVEPEAGALFSGVNIPKPDTLVPENIAEGVNIAGIIGALAAGGSGFNNVCIGTVSAGYSFVGGSTPVTLISKDDLDTIGFGTAAKKFAIMVSLKIVVSVYGYSFRTYLLQSNYMLSETGSSTGAYGSCGYTTRSSSSASYGNTYSSMITKKDNLSAKTAGFMFYDANNGLQFYGGDVAPLYNATYLIIAGVAN